MTVFSTWTTYGTWLRGDPRSWFPSSTDLKLNQPELYLLDRDQLSEEPCFLTEMQRVVVNETIQQHSTFRNWELVRVNCRSNHVHVLVHVPDMPIEIPREQLKAWCTRRLRVHDSSRKNWWTERGWDLYIDTEEDLSKVMDYIEFQ